MFETNMTSKVSVFEIIRGLGAKAGHGIIWVLIAIAFGIVELLVFTTEIRPLRLLRRALPERAGNAPELSSEASPLQA